MVRKILRGLPAHLEMERKLGAAKLDYLLLNLPYECDYNCKKCFVGHDRSTGHLALGERKRVIGEAGKLGARVVVIPGEGEPLMAPELREMIEYQHSLGLITIIFTNASRLTEEWAGFAKENDVSFIISFDSLKQDTYEDLTQTSNTFEQVIENIENCRKIYRNTVKEMDNARIVRLALNTVVTRKNMGEVSAIKKWCGDDMVFVCNFPVREGNAVNFWNELCGNNDEYAELQKLAREKSETGGPTSAAPCGRCAYLFYGITVGADGSILICPDARGTGGRIGNIKENNLGELNFRIKKQLRDFFEKHGHGQCIVRHPEYEKFIDSLNCPQPEASTM